VPLLIIDELGERILKKGLEGVDVAILQQRLCLLGLYDSDDVDGIYGPEGHSRL